MIENKHVRVCDGTVPDRDGEQGPFPPGVDCPVCADWRREKQLQAIPWLLARTSEATGAQSELGRFQA